MNGKLFAQASGKFLAGLILTALLLFLPAGSLGYWNGWLLIGILFVPMFIAGCVMAAFRPKLLKKRLEAREKEAEQRTVIALSGLMFAAAFVIAGLNYRFGWLTVPEWLVWTAAVLFLAAYAVFAEVLRENEYLSRTVEVRDGQKVVDTGLYGIVRHPMYSATLVLFPAMGLVLGSPVSFLILLCYVPIIVRRIRNEELVLLRELDGYDVYMKKVRYRVIPYLW